MKKLLIIMTLFTSSFFLIFTEVKAEEKLYDYSTITNFDINNYITDEYFEFKELALEYLKNNNHENYFFIQYPGDDTYYGYRIYILNKNEYWANSYASDFIYSLGTNTLIKLKKDGTYETSNGSSSFTFNNSVGSRLIDGTVNFYFYQSIRVTYQDYDTLIESGTPYPYLYNIYESLYGGGDSQLSPEKEEQLNILSNFYNITIEKIGYLANEISSNLIYLSIIVIFILIFVFMLIFRRFL